MELLINCIIICNYIINVTPFHMVSHYFQHFHICNSQILFYVNKMALWLLTTHYKTHIHLFLLIVERVRKREGKRNRDMSETSMGCLLYPPPLGTESATWVCAPSRNPPGDLLVYRTTKPYRPGLRHILFTLGPGISSSLSQGLLKFKQHFGFPTN